MRVEQLFESTQSPPHTVMGVVERMVLRTRNDPAGYRSPTLCHSVSLDYAIKRGKPTDQIVFVGVGNKVLHSFVVDSKDNILTDSYAKARSDWNGIEYTAGHNIYQVIRRMTIREFSEHF